MVGAARRQHRRWVGPALIFGLLGAALWPFAPYIARNFTGFAPHAPDWALWAEQPLTLQLHISAALTAFAIGVVILARPKGRALHKALGWGWVAAMGITAGSSFFLTGLNGDFYSLIHLLSGWSIIVLPMAIFAIRNKNVTAHRRAMTGVFVGGLVVAGAFAFLPGRFMFAFLLG